MKKLIYLILLVAISFVSCKKDKNDLIKEAVKEEVQRTAGDPSSYESVDCIIVNTITHEEHLDNTIDKSLSEVEKFSAMDSVISNYGKNSIWAYRVFHSYRLKNENGALQLYNYYFEASPSITGKYYVVYKQERKNINK